MDRHSITVQHDQLVTHSTPRFTSVTSIHSDLSLSPVPNYLNGNKFWPESLLVLGDCHAVVALGVGPHPGHRDLLLAYLALRQGVVSDVITDQASVSVILLDPGQRALVEVVRV